MLAAELVERAARCWIFGGATGASAWGVLWSLDPVLTPAKVSGEGGGGGGAGGVKAEIDPMPDIFHQALCLPTLAPLRVRTCIISREENPTRKSGKTKFSKTIMLNFEEEL